jgi:hypothetical protein
MLGIERGPSLLPKEVGDDDLFERAESIFLIKYCEFLTTCYQTAVWRFLAVLDLVLAACQRYIVSVESVLLSSLHFREE